MMNSYLPNFIKEFYKEHNIGLLAATVAFAASISWAAAGISIPQHHSGDVASDYSCGTAYGRLIGTRTFDFIPNFEVDRYNRSLMEMVTSSHGMVVREEKSELMNFVGHFRNLRNIDPTVFNFFMPEYSENGRTFKLKEISKNKQNQVLEEICKVMEETQKKP